MLWLKNIFNSNTKAKEYVCNCDCGKKYKVITNIYDNSNSGQASCDCGKCKTVIN